VKMFEGNSDVGFGDVLLSEQQIRGNHNPGAGGWPTIRYFNKQTGVEGANYVKKTSKSLCDELGDIEYMKAYIQEAGQTSLCSVTTKKGCSEKESQFIDKVKSLEQGALQQQSDRLLKMADKPMTADNKAWVSQRIAILKQLVAREGQPEL